MKKRAAVARAMAMDPKILFFDEPSAGLDPIVAAGLDEMIADLNKALRVTMAVVTHEMESAFLIAHRMVLIHKGKLIASGTPDEVRASDHPRVRQFLERRPDADVRDEAERLRVLLGEE
jgi:phospholipid/cholesterol/gamma-HCH transport system ATP-binding protein